MEAGKAYALNFKLWSQGRTYKERIEIKIGKENTKEAMTTVVDGSTRVQQRNVPRRPHGHIEIHQHRGRTAFIISASTHAPTPASMA